MLNTKNNTKLHKLFAKIINDQTVRVATVYRSHLWFFHLYFNHYVHYETAPFQHEMFAITEDEEIRLHAIVAFRGSAKSTIFTMSYPLWAILGKQQKKFILILGQTQPKAQQYLLNIKKELESNELLKKDLGPFQEERNQWGAHSLVIPKFNAKITTGSVEQSIRGLRHGPHRPDLIILDDVEDSNSVKTREGRDKTWAWLTGEVIPAGSEHTKIIAVGNLLHEDSLMKRLQKRIKNDEMDGMYSAWPLIDEDSNPLWLDRYPTQEAIEQKRKETMDDVAWYREYLLKIISSADQIVHPEWLQYYDTIPEDIDGARYRYTATGIDLAISEKDSADFTAMVTGRIYGFNEKMHIYILPYPTNERLSFPETVVKTKLIANTHGQCKLFIEEVAYQTALIQELNRQGYQAEGMQVHGQDKASRLRLTTYLIKEKRILFPKTGCEELIEQLVGFGKETHDDLADAFAILVIKALEKNFSPSSAGLGRGDAI